MNRGDGDIQSSADGAAVFSDAVLVQAMCFMRLLSHEEGSLIAGPDVALRIRFGYSLAHARALVSQLEKLGYWSLYIDCDGQQTAQILCR